MNILYKVRRNSLFLIILACTALPAHGFWPRAVCARLSAAICQMPQRIKSCSMFKNFSWFAKNETQSVAHKKSTKWNDSSSSWFSKQMRRPLRYFYGVPFVGSTIVGLGQEGTSQFPKQNCDALADKELAKNTTDHEKTIILASRVLCKLGIDAHDPLLQIQQLSTEQEMQAFNYLQDLFADENDETPLATLYSVMHYLKAARVQWPEFFEIVGNNLGDCCRISLSTAVSECKNIPPRFKEELNKANTRWVTAAYARSYFWETPPPVELHNLLRKVPCSTSTWQAPERTKKTV